MSDFKNILTYVGIDKGCESRIQLAAAIAKEFNAHLTGLHILPRAVYTPYNAIQFPTETYNEIQNAEAKINAELKDLFHKIVADANISDYQWQEVNSTLKKGDHLIAHHAHYQDLLLLPQSPHDETYDNHITPEASILEGSAPVIITPEDTSFPTNHAIIAVAWNASPQATRALHAALPLLKQAKQVHILMADIAQKSANHEDINHHDFMELYLKNHNIIATLHHEDNPHGLKTGELLLDFCEKQSADMLVMGGYSHSRLAEALLHGTSYEILHKSQIPLFISH